MTIPETMNGVVLTGHGGLDKLEWREDLPVPVPQAGEVLIRVGAAALNNTDVQPRVRVGIQRPVRGDTASGAADGYGDLVGKDGGWSRRGAVVSPHPGS